MNEYRISEINFSDPEQAYRSLAYSIQNIEFGLSSALDIEAFFRLKNHTNSYVYNFLALIRMHIRNHANKDDLQTLKQQLIECHETCLRLIEKFE